MAGIGSVGLTLVNANLLPRLASEQSFRGGSPYRGFLEGRTQGDKYALILHFSDLELKAPAAVPTETDA